MYRKDEEKSGKKGHCKVMDFNFMDYIGFQIIFHFLIFGLFAFILIPTLLISYPVVHWLRKCWVSFVKWKHPNCTVVERNSICTILDQGRNQGVHILLLQGNSIAEGVRSHLLHLTSKKKYLKRALTSKWGLYTWENYNGLFSIDNHLIPSPYSFKGRPITESNLQDYVSDVTSKFLPRNQPPWQVHVIDCFFHGERTKVCLIKAHHLLLKEEHLTLADFLPLKYSPESWVCQETDSPFTNLYNEPSALPHLYQKLNESFSNCWNEFLCNNDPIERPEILKKQISLFQCIKIGIIIYVSTLKELTRQYRRTEGLRITDLPSILHREASKRNFGFTIIFKGFIKSLNPIEMFFLLVSWIWYILISVSLKTPILFYKELKALKSPQRHHYPDTLTSFLSYYLPLLFHAVVEILSISTIVITAPKLIFEELLLKHIQTNCLQTISPCGRKVVAWSDEISCETLEKISNVTGATDTEILLTATVDSLKSYFHNSSLPIPPDILATAKFVSQRALFVQNHETRGLLCLALPTRTPFFQDDLLEILQVVQKNLYEARAKQCAIYAVTAAETSNGLLTSCFPSILIKILLNHFTRRYSISLTHVDGNLPVEGVDTAVFWRPPQGNCNMSMTLHRHGNGIRLGVMVDAVLGPNHTVITRSFPKSLENLAITVGVPRTPSRTPSPEPTSPTTSPGY